MINKHIKYLTQAHNLAQKKLGFTYPNPVVGCIIVKNDIIIGRGTTATEGRPHAEEIALKKAGAKAKGANMYVTLEPCFHESRNGSCSDQILRSGIKNIFIARHDPDSRTNKKSIKKLKKNGINVNIGLTSNKTDVLNNFFFKSLKNKRPYIKVKMAVSNDHKIAWKNFNSKWISNSKSRDFAHNIRLCSQAILTTSKTIIKDNPRFTVRKNNKIIKYNTIIVIDNLLKVPLESKIFNDLSKKRIIVFTSSNNDKSKYLKTLGCEIIHIKKQKNEMLNLKLIFKKILSLKINDILVEAGGIFFTNLIDNNLVDELHLFTAPIKIGNSGKSFILDRDLKSLKLQEVYKRNFGKDIYQYFKF